MLSQSEENYIKTIYHLSENGAPTVSTKEIAQHLQMKPASVTDMLGKLSNKNLVKYEKYKGALLSEKGQKTALDIIRKHRLWEFFLVEKLQFSWDKVHQIAEQLEHVNSPELIQRLDNYLGFPAFDPHGDPIPKADGSIHVIQKTLLSELPVGSQSVICGLVTSEDSFLQYLNEANIELGATVKIVKVNSFDASMEIILNNATTLHLSEMVSNNLFVKK